MCLCVCVSVIWNGFQSGFEYFLYTNSAMLSLSSFFSSSSNSPLTIIERTLFHVHVVDDIYKHIPEIYTFESNIPASTLINQFYNVSRCVEKRATERERNRNDRTNKRRNEYKKFWIQNEICFIFPLCVSLSVSVYNCIYLFIYSVESTLLVRFRFQSTSIFDVSVDSVHFSECVSPSLTFKCMWWDPNKYTNLLSVSLFLFSLFHTIFTFYSNMCTQYTAIESTSSPEIYIELSIRLVHT